MSARWARTRGDAASPTKMRRRQPAGQQHQADARSSATQARRRRVVTMVSGRGASGQFWLVDQRQRGRCRRRRTASGWPRRWPRRRSRSPVGAGSHAGRAGRSAAAWRAARRRRASSAPGRVPRAGAGRATLSSRPVFGASRDTSTARARAALGDALLALGGGGVGGVGQASAAVQCGSHESAKLQHNARMKQAPVPRRRPRWRLPPGASLFFVHRHACSWGVWGAQVPAVKAHYGLDEQTLAGAARRRQRRGAVLRSPAGAGGAFRRTPLRAWAGTLMLASVAAAAVRVLDALLALMLLLGAGSALFDRPINAEGNALERARPQADERPARDVQPRRHGRRAAVGAVPHPAAWRRRSARRRAAGAGLALWCRAGAG